MKRTKMLLVVGLVLLAILALAACKPVVETVTVEVVKTEVVQETVVVEKPSFSTPNPILSDLKVRQAMAYCTNKLDIAKAVFPLLTEDQQKDLIMNTFIPRSHWAYAGDANITMYPFDVEKGKALLDEAGWKVPEGDVMRYNEAGDPLTLKFTLTDRASRKAWGAVWEQQMADCGIQILRQHVPASWFYGDNSGTARRDYEVGAWAWVGQADPGGQTLYACDQIPTVENGWQGQNGFGWCNEAASNAIKKANNTLIKQERIDNYLVVQQEYTKDSVGIPLFVSPETFAYNPALKNFDPKPGSQYYTYNVEKWEFAPDGKARELVMGITQEPDTLFTLIASQWTASLAMTMVGDMSYTDLNFDFQPKLLTKLPTIESGLAKENVVEAKAGDMVLDVNGTPSELKEGVTVKDADGNDVEFKGEPVKMKQLVVTYEFIPGIKFSDGVPLTKKDFELGYAVTCDKEVGAVTYITCDKTQAITFDSDTAYTVTWLPGVADPLYYLPPYGWYYADRVVESEGAYKGKKVSEVPHKDWATLPEVTTKPIDAGPYMMTEWVPGEKMVFEANPNYVLGPVKIEKIIWKFITPENAEAQLLTGDVDMLGSETLAGVTETLQKAATDGKITVISNPGTTWEHIDFNLWLR
ncbi:MAG: peptide ABC transporter substrate-binding protein [Anaerolineaceae bacterium]|nr:peptide ABC transporter substrate-binding protein [Anaerolineaceae bacterium]